nr:M28 family peptidase [Cyanobacterium aponinum]
MSYNFSLSTLEKELEAICIPRHPVWNNWGYQKVQEYIETKLNACGKVEKHIFPSMEMEGCNLILKLEGNNPQLAPILIGAHYDGVPDTAAADDNGTAVVALLQLAGMFAQQSLNRSLWLVAFDQEEWGMRGSQALARHLKEQKQPLKLMISLEMLGFTCEVQNYPQPEMYQLFGSKGDYLALVANQEIYLLVQEMNEIFSRHLPTRFLCVPDRGASFPEITLSDHSPFWECGYDGLLLTDTAFLRNPNYHKYSDTIDSLDLDFFAKVVEGLILVTKHLTQS